MRKNDTRLDMASDKKAVALWYPQGASAPFLMAKGRGELAERIVKIASDCGVPVVLNSDAVDVVSIVDVGQCIPEMAWQAVATVLAYVLRTR